MPQIDELQLKIGSDASSAIRQLGDLSTALSSAASAARGLAGATGFLGHFGEALSRITNINMDKTIRGLETLSRIDLSNLKDKSINLDFTVKGADDVDRLKYATAQAAKDVQKSTNEIAKNLSSSFHVDTKGAREVQTIMRAVVKDLASDGNGFQFADPLFKAIHENTKETYADLTGRRKEYEEYVKWFNGLQISPKGIDDWESWAASGFQRILKMDGPSVDQVFHDNEEYIRQHFSSLFDGVDFGAASGTLFEKLAMAYYEASEGLAETAKNDDRFQSALANSITVALENAKTNFDAAVSGRMAESNSKIPIDLDIDQNRFEVQIQNAINKATEKTYETKPLKLKIDDNALRQSVEHAFSLVNIAQLPKFASDFTKIEQAISSLNQSNLSNTGIKEFADAMRRLATADLSKFDTGTFKAISDTVKDLAKMGDVSNGVNRFVSALARLANAGSKTALTADGLKLLTPELKTAVTTFQGVGKMDETINSFVSSLAQMANAGEKAGKTAAELPKLTTAVSDFLTAMSNAPAINTNVANTIQGLGNLAQAGSKAGATMNHLASGNKNTNSVLTMLGKSAHATADAFKKLASAALSFTGKGISAIGSFFGQLGLIPTHTQNVNGLALSFGNLFRAVVPFYGLRGVFDWMKGALETGSGIVEVENVVNTMFGDLKNGYEDLSGYVYKWAEGTIDAFGVSELAARQYAGKLMAMFTSSGFDASEGMRDQAAKMTMSLVERAGDIASFYDIGVDEAMTKIQAGIAGMNRPLRSLGVNLSVANLQTFALTKGITTQWKELDQATQQWLRYEYILEATKYAQGDFTKTSASFANQARILQLNFQALSATIGQGLITAIAPVLGWLNALIRKLIQAAVTFRTFMFTVFGKPLGAVRGALNELAGYADDASDSLASGAGGAADGLGGAADSAKELKKNLSVLPFDELNQLAKDTASASSGGGSGGGAGGGGGGGIGDWFNDSLFDTANLDGNEMLDAISEWGQKIKNAFNAKDWETLGKTVAEGLNRGLAKINDFLKWENWKKKVEGFIKPFQQSFNAMMGDIDWELVGETLANGLNTAVKTLKTWITGFEWKNYGTYLARGMNSMINEFDAAEFGGLIAAKFSAAWSFFSGWVQEFDFANLGTKIKEAIISFLNGVDWEDVGNSIGTFITGIGTTLRTTFEDGSVREELAEALKGLLTGFFNGFEPSEIIGGIKAAASTIIGALGDAFFDEEVQKGLQEDLKSLFEEIPWDIVLKGAAGIFGLKFAGLFFGQGLATLIKAQLLKSGINSAIASALGGTAGASGGSAGGAGAGAGGAGAAGAAGGSLMSTIFAALGLGAGAGIGNYLFANWFGGKLEKEGKLGPDTAWLEEQQAQWQRGEQNRQKVEGGKKVSTPVEPFFTTLGKTTVSKFDQLVGSKIPKKSVDVGSTVKTLATNALLKEITDRTGSNPTITVDAKAGPGLDKNVKTYNSPKDRKVNETLDGTTTKELNSGIELYKSPIDRTVLGTFNGLLTPDFKTAKTAFNSMPDKKNSTRYVSGHKNDSYYTAEKAFWSIPEKKNSTRYISGHENGSFGTVKTAFWSIPTKDNATKYIYGKRGSDSFAKTEKAWFGIYTTDVTKSIFGKITDKFTDTKTNYDSVFSKDSTVTAWGNRTDSFNEARDDINNLPTEKDVKVNLKKGFSDLGKVTLKNISGSVALWGSADIGWNAKGGLFLDPTVMQGFGEAGPEAALPLRNRRSMSMIADAISKAGGVSGGIDERALANAIATALMPVVASSNERPVTVNAVLYTEDNEVLARAVQRGNRRLDKRYNPVSQYAYG